MYNQERFADETIGSIVTQTYHNLEILICDDCSTDSTVEKIREWEQKDRRVKLLPSAANMGLSSNTNKGFDHASGEFVSLMGGDDIMLPQKIEKQVQFLEANPDYDVVLHWVDTFDSDTGNILYTFNTRIINDPSDWFFGRTWESKGNSTFPPTAYLARSSYALKSRYDMRLKYKNEILFAIDNYMHKPEAKWKCLPEVLGKYRIHGNNMHTSSAMNNVLLEETYLNYALAITRYPSLSKPLKSALTYFLFNDLYYAKLNKEISAKYLQQLEKRYRIEAGAAWYYISLCLMFFKRATTKLKAIAR